MQTTKLSQRLEAIVQALPLQPHIRILEIGCGPGAAARAIAQRIGKGHIMGIDRSAKAIEQAIQSSREEIAVGTLSFRCIAIEDFALQPEEQPYDIAFGIRVGALDGRHPRTGQIALPRIARALAKNGKLFIDGGNPLQEIDLAPYR